MVVVYRPDGPCVGRWYTDLMGPVWVVVVVYRPDGPCVVVVVVVYRPDGPCVVVVVYRPVGGGGGGDGIQT